MIFPMVEKKAIHMSIDKGSLNMSVYWGISGNIEGNRHLGTVMKSSEEKGTDKSKTS